MICIQKWCARIKEKKEPDFNTDDRAVIAHTVYCDHWHQLFSFAAAACFSSEVLNLLLSTAHPNLIPCNHIQAGSVLRAHREVGVIRRSPRSRAPLRGMVYIDTVCVIQHTRHHHTASSLIMCRPARCPPSEW